MRAPPQSLALAAATLFLLAAGPATEGSSGKWKARTVRQAEGGCLLPEQPDNGQYSLGGCEAPDCRVRPGDRVEFFAVLNYTCAHGFTLSGASVVFCEGQWSPSPPSCVPETTRRFCFPLNSSVHEIECSLNHPVSCDQEVVPQTRAIVKCKKFYEAPPDKIDYAITCDKNGFWSESLFPCTPECGVFDFNITKETEDGVEKNIPWYAAIMEKDAKGRWNFACSASIISPRVLVSVAHCVWKELDKKVADANNYGVVIGKFEHGPREVTSSVPQLSLVEKIYVPDTFRGYERRYEEDISVIILKDEIIMNKVTRPICIDFDDKYAPYFVPGEKGIIGSWGEPDNDTYKQRVVSLPIVDFEACLGNIPREFHSYLTYDKFCSGVLKKKTVCSGDSGVGYANKFKDGKWYLTGIASVGLTSSDDKSCEIDFYKGFTRTSLFLKFIKKNLDEIANNTVISKPPTVVCRENEFKCDSNECVSGSYLCDGLKHCTDGSDETYEECHLKKCAATSFQCRYGACVPKSYQCNGWKECQDGSDEDPTLCKKNETVISASCSYSPPNSCLLPQQPENGFYTFIGCKSNSQLLPGVFVTAGVLLNYSCNPGYVLNGPSLLACYDDWSSLPPSCNPVLCPPLQNPTREVHECIWNRDNVDCTLKSVKPGTRAGVRCKSNYESIPGLREYDLICEANGKWNREFHSCVPKCGIPNARGVQFVAFGRPSLTAEFPWHVGLYELYRDKIIPTCGGTIVSPHVIISAAHCFWRSDKLSFEQYKVVAGKYFYEWETKIPYVQHLQIKNVIIHENFRGREKNYENDIALIILKRRIVINEAVRPICMDYEQNYLNYFSPGTIGNVSGWGMNENETYSATLNVANLLYVNITECENNTPHQFHSLLTNDKFCAGNVNKTSVCGGDSGGGYTVRFKDGRSYLVGIVSAGPIDIPCGKLSYVTFTNIYHHLELIKHYVYKYV